MAFGFSRIIFNKLPKIANGEGRMAGVTLIQLLLSISILGIILAIGTTAFIAYLARGRDGRRKADLQAVKTSLEVYFQENKKYPIDASCTDFANGAQCTTLRPTLVPLYIKALPRDPKNTGNYVYKYTGMETSYILSATLENVNDKACKPCGPDGYRVESE